MIRLSARIASTLGENRELRAHDQRGKPPSQRPGQERVLRRLAALGNIGATSLTVQQLVADHRRSAAIAKKLGRLGHRRVRRAVVQ